MAVKFPTEFFKKPGLVRVLIGVVMVVTFTMLPIGWFVSREPAVVSLETIQKSGEGSVMVTGSVTTYTLIHVTKTLLDKPGGYLSNDKLPPFVFLDNMPNWEYGALVQVRDLAGSLRNDFSRSRSQSIENEQLAEASPLLNFNNDSWVFPSTESQYRKSLRELETYAERLAQQRHADAQFYARADNLNDWLVIVEKRLGSLSQRLSACVGEARVNTDLAGEEMATQATEMPAVLMVKTPRLKVDDIFYESRGATWALIQFFQAIEQDFSEVLKKKNAETLVQQIIRELEGTQQQLWSPIVLNGGGFALFANHSLVMASYISRANAAVIDLRDVLSQG